MLVLSNNDVSAVLGALKEHDVISIAGALFDSFGSYHEHPEHIVQPLRQSISHPRSTGASTLVMPTISSSAASLKVVTLGGSSGPGKSAASPKGSLFLFSAGGELEATLNGSEVTAFRTALASIIPLAVKYNKVKFSTNPVSPMPGDKLGNVVVFGAGLQAEWALKLLLILFSDTISRITIINRSLLGAQRLSSNLRSKTSNLSIPIECFERSPNLPILREVLENSDAIFCCTPSKHQLFPPEYLLGDEKTRYISLIGSYTEQMMEIDPILFDPRGHRNHERKKPLVLVDSLEGCCAEAGEIIAAKSDGANMNIHELGEIQSGERLKESWVKGVYQGNVIYKSVGMGMMDLVVGSEIVKLAKENGIGVKVEDF